MRAIANAEGFRSTEKVVLYAWLNYADRTGYAYPSVDTLASAARLKRRATQKILARFNALGILTLVSDGRGGVAKSGYGLTTQRRLDIEKLNELSRTLCSAGESEKHLGYIESMSDGDNENPKIELPKSASNSRNGRIQLPERAHSNTPEGAHDAPKPPSNHSDIHQLNHQYTKENTFHSSNGLNGLQIGLSESEQDVRGLLANCGVKGRNLDRLAQANGITISMIKAEFSAIDSKQNVRSKPAVLVHRLSERLKIDLRFTGRLSHDDLSAIDHIESLRRSRPGGIH